MIVGRGIGWVIGLGPTMPDFTPEHARDWNDTGENANYLCRCHACSAQFVGHKRRVTCRLCAELAALRKCAEALRALDMDGHPEYCAKWYESGRDCSCGLAARTAALAAYDEARKEQR